MENAPVRLVATWNWQSQHGWGPGFKVLATYPSTVSFKLFRLHSWIGASLHTRSRLPTRVVWDTCQWLTILFAVYGPQEVCLIRENWNLVPTGLKAPSTPVNFPGGKSLANWNHQNSSESWEQQSPPRTGPAKTDRASSMCTEIHLEFRIYNLGNLEAMQIEGRTFHENYQEGDIDM